MDNRELDPLQKWLSGLAENEEAPVRDDIWVAIAPHIGVKKEKKRLIAVWTCCLPLVCALTLSIGIVTWRWYGTSGKGLVCVSAEQHKSSGTSPAGHPDTHLATPHATAIQSIAETSGRKATSFLPNTMYSAAKSSLPTYLISNGHTIPDSATITAIIDTLIVDSTIRLSTSGSGTAMLPQRYPSLTSELIIPHILLPEYVITDVRLRPHALWQYYVSANASNTILLIRPYAADPYKITSLPDRTADFSPGIRIDFGLKKRFNSHFGWYGQLGASREVHNAAYRLHFLDNPRITSRLINSNELLVDVMYADTIHLVKRHFYSVDLETGLQWYPWRDKTHHLGMGMAMRYQDGWNPLPVGRFWMPALRSEIEIGIGRQSRWSVLGSASWQFNPMDWTYFSYNTLQWSCGIRYCWP